MRILKEMGCLCLAVFWLLSSAWAGNKKPSPCFEQRRTVVVFIPLISDFSPVPRIGRIKHRVFLNKKRMFLISLLLNDDVTIIKPSESD